MSYRILVIYVTSLLFYWHFIIRCFFNIIIKCFNLHINLVFTLSSLCEHVEWQHRMQISAERNHRTQLPVTKAWSGDSKRQFSLNNCWNVATGYQCSSESGYWTWSLTLCIIYIILVCRLTGLTLLHFHHSSVWQTRMRKHGIESLLSQIYDMWNSISHVMDSHVSIHGFRTSNMEKNHKRHIWFLNVKMYYKEHSTQ